MNNLKNRHIAWGWSFVAIFMTLGLVLEVFHSFKVSWYLDPAFEIRRLMWNLAHAHGTLMGLLHWGFAFCVCGIESKQATEQKFVNLSKLLCSSSALFGLGFFLAGFGISESDPGPAIFLVPVAAVVLIYVSFSVARFYVQKQA